MNRDLMLWKLLGTGSTDVLRAVYDNWQPDPEDAPAVPSGGHRSDAGRTAARGREPYRVDRCPDSFASHPELRGNNRRMERAK